MKTRKKEKKNFCIQLFKWLGLPIVLFRLNYCNNTKPIFRVATWPYTLHQSPSFRTSVLKVTWLHQIMVIWSLVLSNYFNHPNSWSPFLSARYVTHHMKFDIIQSLTNILFDLFQTSKAIDAGHELDYKTSIGEWKRRDIQYCRFPGYDLTYAHYTKFPSWGLQDLISVTEVNQISHTYHYPLPIHKYLNDTHFCEKLILSKSEQIQKLQQLLVESTAHEYFNAIANIFVNLLYCAQLLRFYINEYSPLLLFSWWRDKVSWICVTHSIY